MSARTVGGCAVLALTLPALSGCVRGRLEPGRPHAEGVVEWTAYGHDGGGSKYSRAAHITRANVGSLVRVWTYRTGDFSRGDATARDETTPPYVDGVLYASTPPRSRRAAIRESRVTARTRRT